MTLLIAHLGNANAQSGWSSYLASGTVRFLVFDDDGSHGIILNGGVMIDGNTVPLSAEPRHISFDGQGYAYIATANGLVKYNRATQDTAIINVEEIGSWLNSFHSSVIDDDGRLWVGSTTQVTMIDGNDTVVHPSLTPYSLAVDASGRIWAGQNTRLGVYDGNTWTTYTPANSGLPEGCINKIVFDDEQNLWASISCQGNNANTYFKFDGTTFQTFTDETRNIARTPDGYIWAGTFGNGLVRYNPATGQSHSFTQQNSPLRNNFIEYLTVGNEGCLYICYYTGVSSVSYGVSKLCVSTSIEEDAIDKDFNLYPNPSDGSFTLSANLNAPGSVQTEVTNSVGQSVYSSYNITVQGTFNKQIELSLAEGVYQVSLVTEAGHARRKIIITNKN